MNHGARPFGTFIQDVWEEEKDPTDSGVTKAVKRTERMMTIYLGQGAAKLFTKQRTVFFEQPEDYVAAIEPKKLNSPRNVHGMSERCPSRPSIMHDRAKIGGSGDIYKIS